MSLWSTFYSGNINHLQNLLHTNSLQEIENAKDIQMVDFSGGATCLFLLGEDFDPIVNQIKKEKAVPYNAFSDTYTQTIWGSTEPDSEYHAVILDPEFIRMLGSLNNDSIDCINRLICAKRSQENSSLQKMIRSNRAMDTIKNEVLFAVLPVALSIGILTSDVSLNVKILVPIMSFGIFYGLRFCAVHWLNSGRKINQSPHPNRHDWTEQLIELRNFANAAADKNESIIYLSSL